MTAQTAVTVGGPGAPRAFVSDPPPATVRVYALRATSVDLDVALDAAVTADERVPTFELKADWTYDGSYSHRWSNLTRMVESFTLTEELATDLPAPIGFVEGTSAAKLQVTLGGQFMTDGYILPDGTYLEEVDSVRAFSPYGPSGPGALVHAPMELRTGFQTPEGPVSLLQFTGTLTGYSPSASTRGVEINALDPINTIRNSFTLYAYGIDGLLLGRYGSVKYPFAINTQWFIDCILRANGYNASPPWGGPYGYGGCVLSATMHGSYQCEVGSVTYVTSVYYPTLNNPSPTPVFKYGATADPSDPEAHPFQMMYPHPGYDVGIKWLARSAVPMRAGLDGWGMSGWVRLPAAGSTLNGDLWTLQPADTVGPQLIMQMLLVNGVPHAYLLYPDGSYGLYTISGFTLSVQPRWAFIGAHFASEAGGVRISMNFDGAYGSAFVNIPVPNTLSYELAAPVYGRTIIPFTNFSVWYYPTTPGPLDWVGQTWMPTAYVDPGLNWVAGVPDIINREGYDLLKEIVEAEFGTFYFDETGKPFFRSRIVNRGWNREPELLTSQRELSDLVVSVDDSQVRNSISYEYSAWTVNFWEKIWEPEDPNFLTVNANSVNNYVIPIPENTPIISETTSNNVKWVSSELWDQVDDNPYYTDKIVFSASLASNPTVDIWLGLQNGQVTSPFYFVFRLRRLDPRYCYLTIENRSSFGVRFATASKLGTNSATGAVDTSSSTEGKPAFRVTGRRLVENPSLLGQVTHDRSVAIYGRQTYDLGGKNLWRQTGDACNLLASSVMRWTAKPKPVLSDVEVPHNPRRRLNDKIILTEPDSLGAARVWCTLAGRTVTYGPDGARDSLVLRPDDAPPGW